MHDMADWNEAFPISSWQRSNYVCSRLSVSVYASLKSAGVALAPVGASTLKRTR